MEYTTALKFEMSRYIIICLQKGRNNDLEKYCIMFDNCNLRNFQVFLNSDIYPYDNLIYNFSSLNEIEKPRPLLNSSKCMFETATIVIDASKYNYSAIASSVDSRIELEATENLTDITTCCLLINDRFIEYVPLAREVRNLKYY